MSILEEQLTSLVEDGWRLMGVTDALRTIADEGASRIVALTFDDGLLDFLNAFEVLGRLAARATLYVPTDTVGERVSRWDRGHSRLGWEALGQLSAAGVEIGSKAVHNRVLDVLPEGVMCSEVVGSKRLLEDRLARTGVPQLTCDLVHDRGCWCRSAGFDLVQHTEMPSNTTLADLLG